MKMRSTSGLSRRAVVHHDHVDAWDDLQQVVQNGSAEPTAIPRLPGPAEYDVGNPIFLDEGGDGTDEIGAFEGERRTAQLSSKVQTVPDLTLRGRIDVFGGFAGRLDVDGIPRSA